MKCYFGPVRIDPKHVDELVKQVWLVSVTLATASTVVLFSHLDPISARRIANVELPAISELKVKVEKLLLDPFPPDSALVVHYQRKELPDPECVIVPVQLWKLENYCSPDPNTVCVDASFLGRQVGAMRPRPEYTIGSSLTNLGALWSAYDDLRTHLSLWRVDPKSIQIKLRPESNTQILRWSEYKGSVDHCEDRRSMVNPMRLNDTDSLLIEQEPSAEKLVACPPGAKTEDCPFQRTADFQKQWNDRLTKETITDSFRARFPLSTDQPFHYLDKPVDKLEELRVPSK